MSLSEEEETESVLSTHVGKVRWGHSEKVAVCKLGRPLPPETSSDSTLILVFQPPELWGSKFPLFKPPGCGIWQPEETDMATGWTSLSFTGSKQPWCSLLNNSKHQEFVSSLARTALLCPLWCCAGQSSWARRLPGDPMLTLGPRCWLLVGGPQFSPRDFLFPRVSNSQGMGWPRLCYMADGFPLCESRICESFWKLRIRAPRMSLSLFSWSKQVIQNSLKLLGDCVVKWNNIFRNQLSFFFNSFSWLWTVVHFKRPA